MLMVASKSPKLTLHLPQKVLLSGKWALSYHELYPELRNFIWTKVLNGYHCVILPYFSPIPKEEWLNSIESINDILKKFKGGHCQFVESDMLWQHVGKFQWSSLSIWLGRFGKRRQFISTICLVCWEALPDTAGETI
jgi:hypothetical protein